MVDPRTSQLEEILRFRVRKFLRGQKWGQELQSTLNYLEAHGCSAYIVGGVLRDLMTHGDSAKPRDIDIVFDGTPPDKVEYLLWNHSRRKNRFGGLHLKVRDCDFDMWSLRDTWAFRNRKVSQVGISQLPQTTFLNIDAIVLKLEKNGEDRIYSHGFFEALSNRTLEINLEENPFPETCLVRSLLLASKLQFDVGPRLARYIALHSRKMSLQELERVQKAHYGSVEFDVADFQGCFKRIRRELSKSKDSPISLPQRQFKLGEKPHARQEVGGFESWFSKCGEMLFVQSHPIRKLQRLLQRKERSFLFTYNDQPQWLRKAP